MKKRPVHLAAALLSLLLIFTLFGCGQTASEQEEPHKKEWLENELLKDVPMMEGENARYGKIRDVGDKCWAVDVSGTTLAEYRMYLATIEEDGFEKYVDNGKDGLSQYVYSATYTKETRVLSVNYIAKVGVTNISIGEDLELSEHLFYKDEYAAGNQADAKTKLSLIQVYEPGASFVLQLKNGHFIIQDGGEKEDLPYLVDYLESLTTEGEKPVIEAWFISHGHGDHVGCLTALEDDAGLAERVYVDGFYFSRPNARLEAMEGQGSFSTSVAFAMRLFKDTEGNRTKLYRPQIGQRYYFSDITVDVMYTQEQLPYEQEYASFHNDSVSGRGTNYNDTSTWLRFTIEGQTAIFPGDAGIVVSVNAVINYYDREFLDVDILAAPHHGSNVSTMFADAFNCKTLLYAHINTVGSNTGTEILLGTKQLQSKVEEILCYGDGTKVLTFPYEVGTYETLPLSMFAMKKDYWESGMCMIGIDDVMDDALK